MLYNFLNIVTKKSLYRLNDKGIEAQIKKLQLAERVIECNFAAQ